MGTISGSKVDKSEAFDWTMGENEAPILLNPQLIRIVAINYGMRML